MKNTFRFLILILVGLVAGFALAQAVDLNTLPKDWPGLLALLLSGSTGIGVLMLALKKKTNWRELITSKTTWTAISGMFGSIALYFQGQLNLIQLLAALYLGLVTIFLRDAVASTRQTLREARIEAKALTE